MIVRTCSCCLIWNIWTPWCGSVTDRKVAENKVWWGCWLCWSCKYFSNAQFMVPIFSASSLRNTMYLSSLLLSSSGIILKRLKVVSATFLLVCFVCLKKRTRKNKEKRTRKNFFYFTSKALIVLEIIKF